MIPMEYAGIGERLVRHPASPCEAVAQIAVSVTRPAPHRLALHYAVAGQIRNLSLPAPASAMRADGLWQHTCFEVFVRAMPGDDYREFNFAPSHAWAAYRFDSYRSGIRLQDMVVVPRIETELAESQFKLRAELGIDDLPDEAAWQVGLSAVIEETNGRRSWWALAHPPGQPDFHHGDCFARLVPPPSPP